MIYVYALFVVSVALAALSLWIIGKVTDEVRKDGF